MICVENKKHNIDNIIVGSSLEDLVFNQHYEFKWVQAKKNGKTRSINVPQLIVGQKALLMYQDLKNNKTKKRVRDYEFCPKCRNKCYWNKEHRMYICCGNGCNHIMDRNMKNIKINNVKI